MDEKDKEFLSKELPIYYIWSRDSLDDIYSFLQDIDPLSKGAEYLRVVYNKEKKETSGTIAIFSKELYKILCDKGYNKKRERSLLVYPFSLKPNNYPKPGYNSSLFVPVPDSFKEDSKEVLSIISDKLKFLSEQNILLEDTWKIKPILESREKGYIKSGCIINFDDKVSLDSRALVRLLLTDTYWPSYFDFGKTRQVFSCYWLKDNKTKYPVSKKGGK